MARETESAKTVKIPHTENNLYGQQNILDWVFII